VRIAVLLHKTVVHDGRVLREAGALADAGHDVVIVHLPSGEVNELGTGFRLRSATPPEWTRRLPRTLWRIIALGSIARHARAERPDAVHANDIATLIPGYLAARRGTRLVYDTHEYAVGVPYRKAVWAWLAATIERLLIRRCDAVITVSDGIADRLQVRYGLADRPVVVRNVPDLPPPAPGTAPDLRERMGIGSAPLVLHQGAVAEGRGGGNLVRAVARMDSAHLLFLGVDGDFADGLRELGLGLGLDDRLHFHPPVALAELLSYTSQADVGVSLLEDTCENHRLALPNKLFEYLAADLPVVVSDLPEMSRLVSERGVGWTTDPGDPADISRVLEGALGARDDKKLHERVRAAATELNWAHERARLTELYERLAQRVGG
jgi:glycosyltransferase involved in cell wall biosynthesis